MQDESSRNLEDEAKKLGPLALGEAQGIDLGHLSIASREHEEDRRHRHRVEDFREWRQLVVEVFAMVMIGAAFAVASYMAITHSDAKIRELSLGLIGTILTGVFAFLAGRGSK